MHSDTHKLVFIVEDNDMYSMMLDYSLSNDCICRFMSFSTGEECLKHLHLNPSLILLDYHLPGMDGMEVLKEIKRIQPKVPVVVLTSSHDVNVAKSFMKAGVYDFLEKEADTVAQIKKIINLVLYRKDVKEEEEEKKWNKNLMVGVFCFLLVTIILVLTYRQMNS